TETYNGGAHFINISDPLNPVPAGGYGDDGYTHDAQVVTYHGPDTEHEGKEIFIGSNVSEVVIVDVTDKNNPVKLSSVSYPNFQYAHQGWLTEDHRYFILGDELDEKNIGFNTRTLVFDFSDLDNPVYHQAYLGPTPAIDHNGYVKGSLFYLANYSAGVRIIDISDMDNFKEVGYFDTYPQDDTPAFKGVWNVYPFFESGNIVVSDLNGGFFIIRKNN
ncbi:MAG: choice-of-anchor B family protein, partial [Sinomicrobium sp.]|nr:choice-of-anchor B family protein [Sinomicrobium sp.]